MLRSSLILALLALSTTVACTESSSGASADSAAATPIVINAQDIAVAETKTLGSSVLVSGNLDPSDVVDVKAQIGGTITGIRVDRGTPVARGAVLATVEAQGIRSQAAGAEAQVAAARAQLSVAQQRLEGSKRLFEAGAISSIEYKTAQANVEAAEAQLAAARAVAAGASESAARTTITAPINGVISARAVNGGEAVSANDLLFTIVNSAELELKGQVGVTDAARIRVGQPVTFALDGYGGQTFRGSVVRVDPTADPATRQVGVYVRLANQGRRIVGGQYARGRIETGGTTTAVVVPEAALVGRQADSATVYVILGNRVVRRPVIAGARDDATGLVAIHSGLTAGDRVLLNPSSDIGEGTLISTPADRPAAPAPGIKSR